MKILVIDDELAARMVAEIRLSREGKHKVITAPSGRTGLLAAKEKKPDCILLDINMPEMNGCEVLQRLKKNSATRRIPVVMLTGRKDLDDLEISLRLGAIGFLTKPLDKINLADYIKIRLKKQSEKKRKVQ